MTSLLDIRREELRKGIPLYFQSSPPSSQISVISWISPSGSGSDPRGKEGLVALTGRLLKSGTRRSTKRELARTLDRMAAILSVEVDADGITVEIRGPTSVESRMMGILFEVVTEPAFPSLELERGRSQMIERLKRELSQPSSLAERRFMETLYPEGHPYHHGPMGSLRAVSRITASQVRDFHRRHFVQGGTKIVVTSSRAFPEVARDLEANLERHPLREGTPPPPRALARMPSRKGEVLHLKVPGSQQVSILAGGTAPAIHDPSRATLELAHEVLGSRPVLSRLFQVVREQNGLAYYADSSLHMLRDGGYWLASAGTATATSRRVGELLLKEIRRLAEEEIRSSELEAIRNSLIGSFPLLTDSPDMAHSLVQEIALYDLPTDHFLRMPEILRGITATELRRVVSEKMQGWKSPLLVYAGPKGDSDGTAAR